MQWMHITRQGHIPKQARDLLVSSFTTHIYPFPNFPLIRTHIHPKFAILEAGRQLLSMITSERQSFHRVTSTYPITEDVLDIYTAWTRDRPVEAEDDEGYISQDGNDSDEVGSDTNSQRTRPLRINLRKRPHPPEESPSQNRRRHRAKRGHQEGNLSVPLSHRTLVVHKRNVGKRKWSPEAIATWSHKLASVENTNNTEVVSKRQKLG